MRLTFLGTSSGAPSHSRNVSAIGLQFDQQSQWWLFDCGEGTQQQIMRSPLKLSQLERIFITHMHGDHIFGLPGLLASRSLQHNTDIPITVYGPPGLEAFLQATLNLSGSHLGYAFSVVTIQPGRIFENDNLFVECGPLEHRIPAYGYAVVEKPRPGHFEAARAAELGIPAGPLYGRLKNGEVITLPDGRVIDGKTLVGAPRPGHKLVYATDTTFTPSTISLARDATVLIHESTYSHEDLELAERGKHSTAVQAARVAKEAHVQTLILTHFSPRYEAQDAPGIEELLKEAREVFPNTLAAHDFWSYRLP
ncbi:MAG TPA: ribonuclease Z [Chloroflexia bacterium]|nr:ribonuclease Z [Chloroflexia bacterium]